MPNTVTRVEEGAFNYCENLKTAVLSTTLEYLGRLAFQKSGLTAVVIPDSVTYMAESVFNFCEDLREVQLSGSLPNLPRGSFCSCAIEELTIPEGVTTIGESAFSSNRNLTVLHLPASIRSIGESAFGYCNSLVEIYYTGSREEAGAITIGTNNTNLGSAQWHFIQPTITHSGTCGEDVTWTLDSNGLLKISGNGAIKGSPWNSVKSDILMVVIEPGISSIGAYAFEECVNMTAIRIPDTVEAIGDYAFRWCTGLPALTLPNSLILIGREAFYHCDGLKAVSIPSNVETVGVSAFNSCEGLESLVLSKGVSAVGASAFRACNKLKSVLIPCSIKSIGYCAFAGDTSIENVSYGGSEVSRMSELTIDTGNDYLEYAPWTYAYPSGSIGNRLTWSMRADGLLTITGSGSIPDYSSSRFAPWHLYVENVNAVLIESGITGIGAYAFASCSRLTVLTVPETLLAVGEAAVADCVELADVHYPGSRNQWNAINVGADNTALSGAALHLGRFDINIGEITNGSVTAIVNGKAAVGALEGDEVKLTTTPDAGYQLDTLSVKQGMTDAVVTDNSFTMPAGDVTVTATFIAAPAFGPPTFTLPASTKSVGESAFEGLPMTIVEIPDGCTSIGAKAFKDCANLTQIRIPASVTSIDTTAFEGCKKVLVYGTINSTAQTFCAYHANCTFVAEN